jgi:Tc toxin complex TcA C-terminal TcB-binding domain
MLLPGGGKKNAVTENSTGDVLTAVADIASPQSGLNATQGSWDRRLQDWQNQIDIITVEIQQIKRQQLASWRRRHIALRERNNHRRQMEHAAEVEAFLRDKFTKHQPYLYLQQENSALYAESYRPSMKVAQEVQQAFWYEHADSTEDFLKDVTWDSLHEGLTIGEKLEVALHSMEQSYMDLNCRKLELIKQFSLRQQFDTQFGLLKTRGYCEIDIPE